MVDYKNEHPEMLVFSLSLSLIEDEDCCGLHGSNDSNLTKATQERRHGCCTASLSCMLLEKS
jgi:hypothetical protein